MDEYGRGEGHLVAFFVPAARAQAIHFIDTAGREVTDAHCCEKTQNPSTGLS